MTQEKAIQAIGRVGRKNTSGNYSIRLRNNDLIHRLFMKSENMIEVNNINRLFAKSGKEIGKNIINIILDHNCMEYRKIFFYSQQQTVLQPLE